MQGLVSVRNTLSSESGGVRTEHRSLQEGNQRQIRRKKNRETFAGGTHDAINRNRTTSYGLKTTRNLSVPEEHLSARSETHDRKLSRLLDQGHCFRKSPQDCETDPGQSRSSSRTSAE